MSLSHTVESLLFVSTRPLTAKKIAEICNEEMSAVEKILADLLARYEERSGGIRLVKSGAEYQLMTAPEGAATVQKFLKDEMTGELTRPSLETLTIIAYRGPVTKAEIEQIRGVNCSLILRNLLMRGLIEAEEDKRALLTRYRVTLDFLRYLGVNKIEELPDYAALSTDKTLNDLLAPAGRAAEPGAAEAEKL
jgi:segregation and condensation protein B